MLLLASTSLSGCSFLRPEEKIVVQTKYVERNIPTVPRPKGFQLNDVQWYIVAPENFQEFKVRYEKENGNFVFFVLSVPGYENLSLNMAEIKRYIEQQKSIIIYYEEQTKPKPIKEEKK